MYLDLWLLWKLQPKFWCCFSGTPRGDEMDSNSQSPYHARVGSIGSEFSNVLVRGVWYAFGIPS